MNSEKGQGWLQFDPQMLVALSAMLAIGLLAVHSAMYREPSWFTKQILSVLVGIVLMLVMARIPYHFWHRRSALLILLAILSLAAVLFFGKELYGARRQFVIGGISLQPSEFCKLAVIIYVADWLSSRGKQIRQVNYGLIPFSVILGVVAGLILREPDISTAIVMVLTAGTMFFVAGAELLQILIAAGFGTLAVSVVITQTSYATDRIHKYLAVLNDPLAISPSPISLCLAGLRNGKWLGVGLGKGDYKLWIEPAHSDLLPHSPSSPRQHGDAVGRWCHDLAHRAGRDPRRRDHRHDADDRHDPAFHQRWRVKHDGQPGRRGASDERVARQRSRRDSQCA